MAEAQKGFATLDDVDTGTFVRFIEWAHKTYYTAAEFAIVVEEDSNSPGSCTDDDQASNNGETPSLDNGIQALNTYAAEAEEDCWGKFPSSIKKSKLRKRISSPKAAITPTSRENLMHSFISRRPVERKSAIGVPPPRRNQSSVECYSDVFLSHARLYVFAEKYDIQPLKTLALDELHAILAIFTLYPDRTGDIIDLLRYVYTHTSESREDEEDMRTLMTQYVGYEMDTLMNDEDFKDLMIEDGGPLLDNFMAMVGRRISSAM